MEGQAYVDLWFSKVKPERVLWKPNKGRERAHIKKRGQKLKKIPEYELAGINLVRYAELLQVCEPVGDKQILTMPDDEWNDITTKLEVNKVKRWPHNEEVFHTRKIQALTAPEKNHGAMALISCMMRQDHGC